MILIVSIIIVVLALEVMTMRNVLGRLDQVEATLRNYIEDGDIKGEQK